jgi:hypothetical protein
MGSSPIISSRFVGRAETALDPGVSSPGALAPDGVTGGSNSVVESQPSKLLVAGSIPVSRSRLFLASVLDAGVVC